jgi:hypothetical protein
MTTLADDPFTRTTSPGIGNEPVTGAAYSHSPNTTGWSTTGTVARQATAAINQLYYATVDVLKPDHVIRVTQTVPVVPAGSGITIRTVGRWTDASNFYEALIAIVSGTGAATLTIQKRVAGVASAVTGSTSTAIGTHLAGNAWTTVLEIYGNTVRARAWNATSGSDPISWQQTGTDTTGGPPATGTQIGFGCRRETGNTNGAQNIDFDNFSALTLIDVIQQDVWPPRVLVTASSLQVGDTVALYRVVAGDRFLVQNGSTTSSPDVAFFRVDAEIPFGIPVSYVAVINNDETSSVGVVYTLTGGKVAVSDAISGLAAEAVIWAWPEKAYSNQATLFQPGGRNVVVSGKLGQFEADVELYTDALSSGENLLDLLRGATQGIVQVRQAGGYGDVDCHVVVTSYRPRRFSQDGSDEKRIHALHVVEVDGWASALAATGFTYQDLADTYVGLTYAQLNADFPTYLALAQGDFS